MDTETETSESLGGADDIALADDLTRRYVNLRSELGKLIVGQDQVIEQVLLTILAGGNSLIVGVPGLAKTLTVSSLAQGINAQFQRIQFTPDLLPADLLGTLIFNQRESSFSIKKGPIFANIILADEINRSPAKVQSALLESMQERQVTIGDTTFKLDEVWRGVHNLQAEVLDETGTMMIRSRTNRFYVQQNTVL